MRIILSIILSLTVVAASAQDTLTVMHYNVLNYGINTSYCTPTNNDISQKEGALRTIFAHTQPDILTLNEMNPNAVYHLRFMDSTLHRLYPDVYNFKAGTNFSGDIHANGIMYRKDKLALEKHVSLQTNTRDFDIFTLYYKDPILGPGFDTIFFHIAVCHLKAGSDGSDKTERNNMALILMAYLDTANLQGALFFAGDMNMKNSYEAAWSTLTNYSNPAIRFQDPISSPGSWNNNSSFAGIHTQSTQTNTSGCASGGGMDDRFDIILANSSAMTGAHRVKYIQGSYKAFGNDGQHFNSYISSGTNTAVPQAVADALHLASDHLPLLMNIEIDQSTIGFGEFEQDTWIKRLRYYDGNLCYESASNTGFYTRVFALDGREVHEQFHAASTSDHHEALSLKPGIYLFKASTSGHPDFVQKIVVVD